MASNATAAPALGTLIRMRALKPTEIPAHPELAAVQGKGDLPPLDAFISAVLDEGRGFMIEYLPKKFRVKGEKRQSPPSAAPVELLHHEISAHDIPEEGRSMGQYETWFARTSVHDNAAKAGTASWEEFDAGLREDHSQHEMDYTPDLIEAHQILNWQQELDVSARQVDGWKDVDVVIMEMVHKIPFPLQPRVFPVLVISARKEEEFIDVQIPVDTSQIAKAKYAKDSKVTEGMYCSIERGTLIEDGAKVKWDMATASDAKGVLPMSIQKLGVPGAVVKDVGLFVQWCEKKRSVQA